MTYAAAFLSLLTLPLLPRQKAQVQQWKRDWPRKTRMLGALTILVVGLVYSGAPNVLAVLPATMCTAGRRREGC